jgi:hypothetical protein
MGIQSKTALQPGAQTIARLRAPAPLDAAIDILRRDGVLVIEDAIPPEQLARIDADMKPWFDAAFHGAGALFGRKTKRFGGLFAKAASTADLALDPTVLALMEQILKGPDPAAPRCDAIELNLTQAIGIEPGEPAQFLHRDEELWSFPHTFELMTNAMWALDDFTAENGATRLIPGSHLWPRDREPQPGVAISAEAPKGSVILWVGGVLHAGGANRSNAIRRGLVMSYRLGWLASGEKLLLSTPPEVARRLPERLQRLLGYQLHRPNLGWVEGQDPIRWLHGEVRTLAPVEDNLSPFYETILHDLEQNPDNYLAYLT